MHFYLFPPLGNWTGIPKAMFFKWWVAGGPASGLRPMQLLAAESWGAENQRSSGICKLLYIIYQYEALLLSKTRCSQWEWVHKSAEVRAFPKGVIQRASASASSERNGQESSFYGSSQTSASCRQSIHFPLFCSKKLRLSLWQMVAFHVYSIHFDIWSDEATWSGT